MVRCPGQGLRFWKLDDIFDVDCPHCGTAVEFWKDEPGVKCPQCRNIIANPRLDLGCAQWCQHVEQCLGTLVDPESILSKKLSREIKSFVGEDAAKIDHALAVLKNAQEIVASEHGDARVVYAAATLHVLDGPCPERVPPECAGLPDRTELPATRQILSRCAVDAELAERICTIIARLCRDDVEDCVESKVLWDTEWLARVADPLFEIHAADQSQWLESTFSAQEGRKVAMARLSALENESSDNSH